MIEYKIGDILKGEVEALVNTVNCVGVMGRGIALQFKKAFPDNFKAYYVACKKKLVKPGEVFVYKTGSLFFPQYIVNFPTKRHWRNNSRIEDIESGLDSLASFIGNYNISSIAIPPLGCGLGGLDWKIVKSLIEDKLGSFENVEIHVYEPIGAPSAVKMVKEHKKPKMTPGRAALIGLMQCYLNGLLDPFVTLLEVHKLMFFLQESGEPLRLKYQKAHYGPYADNLRHVLNAIEGYFISGYADGGDNPNKELVLREGALSLADDFLKQHLDTKARFDRVNDLVEGFESPFGLELLSTVYWVIKNESASSEGMVIKKIYDWNEGKKKFKPKQIELAIRVLSNKGWIRAI